MFVDRAEVAVRAGDGGRGAVAFRREKYVPLGGPSGGDGGRGGSVWVRGDTALATLLSLQHRREFRATDGAAGASKKRHGAFGADCEVAVPLGTELRDADTGVSLADVVRPGQRVLVAKGGDGGRGNARFRTSIRQAPRFAERGEPGQQRRLALELRVLADVGLIGMPNAGKSTLLAAVSSARPKIAAYPFTTLEPQLGVVRRGERELVLADIPGLIEGAHAGHGLGSEFLRHVQRCRLLVHVVDGAAVEGRDPAADFETVERELRLHDPALAAAPRVLVGNKADLPAFSAHWESLRAVAGEVVGAFAVSAATATGTEALVDWLLARIAQMPPRYAEEVEPPPTLIQARGLITVRRGGDGVLVIDGPALSRLVRMADLSNPEALDYLLGRLLRMGVPARLRQAGAHPGDTARIEDWVFPVGDDGVPLTADIPADVALDPLGTAAEADDDDPPLQDGPGAAEVATPAGGPPSRRS